MTYSPHRGSYAEAAWNVLGGHAELSNADLAKAIGCSAGGLGAIMEAPLKHGMLTRTKRDGLIWWSRGNNAPAPRPDDDEDDGPLNGRSKRPASSVFEFASRHAQSAPGDEPEVQSYTVRWPGTEYAATGEATSPAYGSQTPDSDAAIPPARAGRETPQEGINRGLNAGQSHGATGFASPTGRGTYGALACGDIPVFIPDALAPQHVVKAEGSGPDATDRGVPVPKSPVGGPTGAGQAAAAAPADGLRIALWSDGTLQLERDRSDLVLLTRDEVRQMLEYLNDPAAGVRERLEAAARV